MTVITAASGAVSGMATLTVTGARLASIAVTPATPSIAKGTKQQFVATGTYGDGTTQNLTAMVTWASATAATATISQRGFGAGLATSVAAGTTVISATSSAVRWNDDAHRHGGDAGVDRRDDAGDAVDREEGPTGNLRRHEAPSATATQNLATATWASATASDGHDLQRRGLGRPRDEHGRRDDGHLGHERDDQQEHGQLTVTAATLVSMITVTPATPSIARTNQRVFVATGTYSDATTQNLTGQVTWASATTATATISSATGSAGLATERRPGHEQLFPATSYQPSRQTRRSR